MKDKIKTLDLVFLLACNMTGIGVFSIAHDTLVHTGSCTASLLLVVASGMIATIFGLCYAELGATYPQAGGDLNYLSKAYSKYLGTAYSLVSIVFILPLCCSVMSIKVFECFKDDISQDLCVSLLLGTCCLLMTFGRRLLTWVVRILFFSKVATVVFLLMTSLLSFTVTKKTSNPAISDPRSSVSSITGLTPIIHGLCFTQFSFDGWNCGNYIANRISNPGRTFPRAIVSSIWCVVFIYTLINLSFMWVVPYDNIVNNELFMTEYFQIIGISIAPRILSIAVTLVPTLGSLLCSFVVSSGIIESLVPTFSKRMEVTSLCLFSLNVFLFTKFSSITAMINRIAFGISLFYSLSCFGLFLLK